jgi:pyridoxal phosphate enzyme (YggS family)
MNSSASLAKRLHSVQEQIATACIQAGRRPADVQLLAVSKTFAADAVLQLAVAGQLAFGENYVQEALDKIQACQALREQSHASLPPLQWHFIGPLQSNKTRQVAAAFDWVHSVDRLKIAQRLSEQRPADLPDLQICLQVNISAEASKSGLAPTEVLALAQAIQALPRLRLRGLMAIPEPTTGIDAQRKPLRALRELLGQLNAQGLNLDTLSMGMSADLEAAVLEGATWVRIGSALFGPRPAVH